MGVRVPRWQNVIALIAMTVSDDDFIVAPTRTKALAMYKSAKNAGVRIRTLAQGDGTYKVWRVG